MAAALAVSEEEGKTLEETVRLSTAVGAANVMCSGTQAAEYEVVEHCSRKCIQDDLRTALKDDSGCKEKNIYLK